MRGRVIAFFAIVLFLFAMLPATQQGYWGAVDASQEHVEFNQTLTVDNGTVHSLNVSNRDRVYAPQSEINVTQSGTQFDDEGNWSWNRHNGTILIFQNAQLTNGSTAYVSGYYAVGSRSQNFTRTVALLPQSGIGDAWLLMGMVMLVLMALAAAARVTK